MVLADELVERPAGACARRAARPRAGRACAPAPLRPSSNSVSRPTGGNGQSISRWNMPSSRSGASRSHSSEGWSASCSATSACRRCCCSPPLPAAGAGANIGISAVAAASASVAHIRAGRVNWRLFGWMAPPLDGRCDSSAATCPACCPATCLLFAIAAVLFYSAVDLLRCAAQAPARGALGRARHQGRSRAAGVLIGVLGGIVGLILGTLRMPALLRFVGEAPARAVGTNAAVGVCLGIAGVIGHLPSEPPDWDLLAVGAAASIPGAVLGARLVGRLSEKALLRHDRRHPPDRGYRHGGAGACVALSACRPRTAAGRRRTGEAPPRWHGASQRPARARPVQWAVAVRDGDGRSRSRPATSRGSAGKLAELPGVRGVARLGEAFALIPVDQAPVPEVQLPFEDVKVRLRWSRRRRSPLASARRPPRAGRESAVAGLSIAPTALALRDSDLAAYHGVEHKAIAGYEQDTDAADTRQGARALRLQPGRADDDLDRHRKRCLPAPCSAPAARSRARSSRSRASACRGRAVRLVRTKPRDTARPRLQGPGNEMQRLFATREPTPEQLDTASSACR